MSVANRISSMSPFELGSATTWYSAATGDALKCNEETKLLACCHLRHWLRASSSWRVIVRQIGARPIWDHYGYVMSASLNNTKEASNS